MAEAIQFSGMSEEARKKVLDVRDAVFEAADGKALDVVMLGTLMAQGKIIASVVRDPDQARKMVDGYHAILRAAMDAYCKEFSH